MQIKLMLLLLFVYILKNDNKASSRLLAFLISQLKLFALQLESKKQTLKYFPKTRSM